LWSGGGGGREVVREGGRKCGAGLAAVTPRVGRSDSDAGRE
jgi:hypothetical protein